MDFSPFEFNENTLKFSNLLNESEVYYRVVAPSDLNLQKRSDANVAATEKRAKRHDISKRRRGRPRKGLAKRNVDEKPPDDAGDVSARVAPADTTPLSRTRYGRVTRPPKHMSKFIDINEPSTEHLAAITPENNFHPEVASTEPLVEPKKIRRNLERFTCGVCKKVCHCGGLLLPQQKIDDLVLFFSDLFEQEENALAFKGVSRPQNAIRSPAHRRKRSCEWRSSTFTHK